jgi:hypothetical protein
MRSIELTFDPSLESAIRAEWAALESAGLPNLGRHPHVSNRPHLTLAAGAELEATDAVRAVFVSRDERPTAGSPGTAPPGTAQPGTAPSGTAQPGTAPPGTAPPGPVPNGTGRPGTARPAFLGRTLPRGLRYRTQSRQRTRYRSILWCPDSCSSQRELPGSFSCDPWS